MHILTICFKLHLTNHQKYNLGVYKHIDLSLIHSITEPLSTSNLSVSLLRLVNE